MPWRTIDSCDLEQPGQNKTSVQLSICGMTYPLRENRKSECVKLNMFQ